MALKEIRQMIRAATSWSLMATAMGDVVMEQHDHIPPPHHFIPAPAHPYSCFPARMALFQSQTEASGPKFAALITKWWVLCVPYPTESLENAQIAKEESCPPSFTTLVPPQLTSGADILTCHTLDTPLAWRASLSRTISNGTLFHRQRQHVAEQ